MFRTIGKVIPLGESVVDARKPAVCFGSVSNEVLEILQYLDRTVLIRNVTKYLSCGFIAYDPEQLEEVYGSHKLIEKTVSPIALIVFALGILYKRGVEQADLAIANKLYKECSDITSPFHENISLEMVQVLSLMSWFLRAINKKDSCMLLSSMSIHMAASMDLHALTNSRSQDHEAKTKVWWAVYSINRLFSVRSGQPVYLSKESIITPKPQWKELSKDDKQMMDRTYEVAILAEDVLKLYLNRSKTKSVVTDISDLLHRLLKWKEVNSFVDIPRRMSSVYLSHSYLIQLTTIPLLLHLTIQKLTEKSVELTDPNMLNIISVCHKYAVLSITILTSMSMDSIANFGVFDIEYISTSTFIIGMISVLNVVNDSSATLDNAIALLDHIGIMGSSMASENYRKMENFLNEIKNFVDKQSPNGQIMSDTTPPAEFARDIENVSFNLWDQIYNDITLDMNTNWDELLNFLT